MAKPWRRTSRDSGTGTAVACLTILSITVDDTNNAQVQFSEPLTWDNNGTSSLIVAGQSMEWVGQPQPDTLTAQINAGSMSGGEAWDLPGPEDHITPTPCFPQSGTTVHV